jgi:hypothetical protein
LFEPTVVSRRNVPKHDRKGQQHREDHRCPEFLGFDSGVIEFKRDMLVVCHLDDAVNDGVDGGVRSSLRQVAPRLVKFVEPFEDACSLLVLERFFEGLECSGVICSCSTMSSATPDRC